VSLQSEKTSYGCRLTVESILRSLAVYCEEGREGKCGIAESKLHAALVMPFMTGCTVNEETQVTSASSRVGVAVAVTVARRRMRSRVATATITDRPERRPLGPVAHRHRRPQQSDLALTVQWWNTLRHHGRPCKMETYFIGNSGVTP
jgi:hypothetical protein